MRNPSLTPIFRAHGRRLTVIGIVLCIPACLPGHLAPLYTFDGLTMGSTYSVKVVADPLPASREEIQKGIDGILTDIDSRMSTYKESSELSRLNQNQSGDWIQVSDSLFKVLEVAIRVSKLSDGAFDVTVGPLVNLWGFGPDGRITSPPADEAITAARARVGFQKLELDPAHHAVRKLAPDLYIDLSAIAQGYAADEVGRYLQRIGVHDYMAEIAGEIHAAGVNQDGKPWRIGVERPGNGEPDVQQVIELHNAGMATSGDYRNFFEENGVRYSHHIDPATGRPVTHSLASVSVVHASATFADAMATALLVLGPERGMALAKAEKLPVFFIMRTEDGFEERQTVEFDRLRRD